MDIPPNLAPGLLLGTGGHRPGLWAAGREGSRPSPLLRLPEGYSVYAVDVAPAEGLVAAGTRAGTIELLPWSDVPAAPDAPARRTLIQGAPLLAVCLLGQSRLASADTKGRCILWTLDAATAAPMFLDTQEESVCALLRLPDDRLAGLTSGGALLLWDSNDGRLLQVGIGPCPPDKLALVHIRYWPECNGILAPAEGGQLVLWSLDDLSLRVQEAHRGAYYALFVDSNGAHTIGLEDGVLNTWECPTGMLHQVAEVPKGFICGEAMPGDATRLVLIDEAGGASMYEVAVGSVRLLRRLEGECYRVVACPQPEALAAFAEKQCVASAEQLRGRIQTLLDDGALEEAEDLLPSLEGLGFQAHAVAFHAQLAARRQDLVEELRAWKQLCDLVPHDDPLVLRSRARFASVLEALWQLGEAEDLRGRTVDDQYPGDGSGWLPEAAGILEGDGWVVEPDVPIPTVIQAATVMGRPFVGRWSLRTGDPVAFPGGRLPPDALAEKYEQLKLEARRPELPLAKAQELWWVSRGSVKRLNNSPRF